MIQRAVHPARMPRTRPNLSLQVKGPVTVPPSHFTRKHLATTLTRSTYVRRPTRVLLTGQRPPRLQAEALKPWTAFGVEVITQRRVEQRWGNSSSHTGTIYK